MRGIRNRPRRDVVVDTPPPTVSGSLHVGHLFSYSHQDFIVRFQRMRGKNIFFPIGWDDNGLPTERRVQNLTTCGASRISTMNRASAERGTKAIRSPSAAATSSNSAMP